MDCCRCCCRPPTRRRCRSPARACRCCPRPAPTAVEEASGDFERPLLLARLLLLLLLLSVAHEMPLSVACASLSKLPAPTAVRRRAGT